MYDTFIYLPFKKVERDYILWSILLLQTALTCFYAAYERYALPLIPFLFIIIGVGTVATVMKISKLLISKNSLK